MPLEFAAEHTVIQANPTVYDPRLLVLKQSGDFPTEAQLSLWLPRSSSVADIKTILVICQDKPPSECRRPFNGYNMVLCDSAFSSFIYNDRFASVKTPFFKTSPPCNFFTARVIALYLSGKFIANFRMLYTGGQAENYQGPDTFEEWLSALEDASAPLDPVREVVQLPSGRVVELSSDDDGD
jgi:hypothetical protein